jgi:hypothetical protein
MATVWLARDLGDRLVAISCCAGLGAPAGAERFASEIGIVAKLNHSILRVVDSASSRSMACRRPATSCHVEGPSLRRSGPGRKTDGERGAATRG